MDNGYISKYIPDLENKDLLFISFEKDIPANYNGISCSFNLDDDGKIQVETIEHKKQDPSTIWIYLPILEPTSDVPPLPYFPHYIDLLPQQRYIYLQWLQNVEKPIDIGYVFLYFYGLERHLILGDIDKAIKQIIRLRNNHPNKSFQKYTQNSIIHACIMRNRLDLLITLNKFTEINEVSNAQLLLAHNLNLSLSVDNLTAIFYKMFPKIRKALKENKTLMTESVKTTLMQFFGCDSYPITSIDVSNAPIVREVRFCNYTFPKDIRFVEITDFYKCKEFVSKIQDVFENSYLQYKSLLPKKNRPI